MLSKIAGKALGGEKGIVGSVVDGGVRIAEDRGETKRTALEQDGETERSRHSVTKQFNAGSAFWRPLWMFCVVGCVVAYVLASLHFYNQWLNAMKLGESWAIGSGMTEWKSGWVALGASIFSLATISFLGYSPFRSMEKGAKTLAGTGVGESIGSAIRSKLPRRSPEPEIVREDLQEPDGPIQKLPGVVVPSREPAQAQPVMNTGLEPIDKALLEQEIRQEEGYRDHIYLDSLGFKTAGVGHLLIKDDPEYGLPVNTKVSPDRINEWFRSDMQSAIRDTRTVVRGFDALPREAKHVLISMAFQLGGHGLSKFKNMLAAIQRRDWNKAADESLDSKAARQTPERWSRHANVFRSLVRQPDINFA